MRHMVGLAVLTMLVLVGCGATTGTPPASPSASPTLTAAQLATRYDLDLKGAPQVQTRALPSSLSALPWTLYQHACREGGFDLRPYRGQQVTFTEHPLRETPHGSQAALWTVERGGNIIGAYVAVADEAPGIYSLQQAKAGL